VGEALGLRHEDICPAGREITIVPRANDNGARSKSRDARTVPVSTQVIRLWGDYLHEEYGDLDSDYVFVNLFAAPRGRALGYPAVYDLIRRLQERTGIDFDPHWCRHSAATRMLRDGVPVEVVSMLTPDRPRRPRAAGPHPAASAGRPARRQSAPPRHG
jgi:integrase/recombinase XerD